LTISSNFVGCSTGTSAVSRPLRILSTKTAARARQRRYRQDRYERRVFRRDRQYGCKYGRPRRGLSSHSRPNFVAAATKFWRGKCRCGDVVDDCGAPMPAISGTDRISWRRHEILPATADTPAARDDRERAALHGMTHVVRQRAAIALCHPQLPFTEFHEPPSILCLPTSLLRSIRRSHTWNGTMPWRGNVNSTHGR
jgi:hypothetical protein